MLAISNHLSFLLVSITILLHLFGIIAALDALFTTRSSQAAIAWGISLILFPYVLLPIYLIFGRPRLTGYRKLSRKMNESRKQHGQELSENEGSLNDTLFDTRYQDTCRTLERIAHARFRPGNSAKFLIDGHEFYSALLTDIRSARQQVDLCFYVIRADTIGQKLKEELIAAKARGVTVRFLYDKIGSFPLPAKYLSDLQRAGIELANFNPERSWRNIFYINFRNHRKISLIDHSIAYVGGFNVGDEYLGLSEEIGYWRDTQVRIEGPAVADIASVFSADWAWATGTRPQKSVEQRAHGSAKALTIATGPADEEQRATLIIMEIINSAKDKLWISSPYYVPDEAITTALNLAIMRGVDVRILIPDKGDNYLVQSASLYHAHAAVEAGIKVYRYKNGFLHQKVWLVDEALTLVSTANLDNRSLRLNFEISVAFLDKKICEEVRKIFEEDFENNALIKKEHIQNIPFFKKLGGSIARLLSPIL